jgi:hypothetical protein
MNQVPCIHGKMLEGLADLEELYAFSPCIKLSETAPCLYAIFQGLSGIIK